VTEIDEIGFKMVAVADSAAGVNGTGNANQIATTSNGNTVLREIQVEANGITVYNNVRANETANILTHLDYTKPYSDSIGTDQFFYPDTNTGGTAEPRDNQAAYNVRY